MLITQDKLVLITMHMLSETVSRNTTILMRDIMSIKQKEDRITIQCLIMGRHEQIRLENLLHATK